MRRLALFFDGTWNNYDSRTNVSLLKSAVREGVVADGAEQCCFYDPGVGTTRETRLSGGIFGSGLSENVQDGYDYLCRNHQDGDQIFIFGFSRGAYTARSLVGLVRKAGLLRGPTKESVAKAYAFYKDGNVKPNDPPAVEFRATHSREARVHFIGVWDTVGALGIPLTRLPVPFRRSYYEFHDTELSGIVDYAYHALAVDEHRKDYQPTLWTNAPKSGNVEVEQRWFVGAHADVGGGYRDDDRLRYLPLAWVQGKAAERGLVFKETLRPDPDAYRARIHDSFREFLHGVYWLMKLGRRFYRPIGAALRETVDESVHRRRRDVPDYRPPGLPT